MKLKMLLINTSRSNATLVANLEATSALKRHFHKFETIFACKLTSPTK